jgi:hypothetical protein
MLYRPNSVFDAVSCRVNFQNTGRLVLLTFETDNTRLWLRVPEPIMADITGQFLRERLFGLH